jgi:hypothetical protein
LTTPESSELALALAPDEPDDAWLVEVWLELEGCVAELWLELEGDCVAELWLELEGDCVAELWLELEGDCVAELWLELEGDFVIEVSDFSVCVELVDPDLPVEPSPEVELCCSARAVTATSPAAARPMSSVFISLLLVVEKERRNTERRHASGGRSPRAAWRASVQATRPQGRASMRSYAGRVLQRTVCGALSA